MDMSANYWQGFITWIWKRQLSDWTFHSYWDGKKYLLPNISPILWQNIPPGHVPIVQWGYKASTKGNEGFIAGKASLEWANLVGSIILCQAALCVSWNCHTFSRVCIVQLYMLRTVNSILRWYKLKDVRKWAPVALFIYLNYGEFIPRLCHANANAEGSLHE